MPWIIVKFTETDEVEVVPDLWFNEQRKTLSYPNFKSSKIISAIKNELEPEEDWEEYGVVLMRKGQRFGNFTEASKKAQKACFTSDISESELLVNATKRIPKKKVFSSESDDSEESLCTPPKLTYKTEKAPTQKRSEQCYQVDGYSEVTMRSGAIGDTEENVSNSSDEDKKFKKLTITLLNKICKQLTDLETRVQYLDTKIEARNEKKEPDQDEIEVIFQQFPLNSEEALTNLEQKLQDNKDLHKFLVNCLKKIGGSNYKEATRRIARKLISDAVAVSYSLKGHKSKKPFIHLKCDILIDAVQASSNISNRKEIELALGTWLAKASERLKIPQATAELEERLDEHFQATSDH